MRRLEGRQAPQQHDRQPVEGRWVLGPLCSAWVFFFVEVFGQFYESCGHRKKLRRNKRTSEIFRWWLFQYGSLERRNSWTTISWNGSSCWLKVLRILACWRCCFFVWTAALQLLIGEYPGSAVCITDKERLMRPLRTWNRILQVFFWFFWMCPLYFLLGDVVVGNEAAGVQRWEYQPKVCGLYWFYKDYPTKSQQFSIIGKKSPCFIF